jgi:AGZA family xanthine/uracil permease-like MFS transporter
VALAGLVLTLGLMARRSRGAILIGILGATALAWAIGLVEYEGIVARQGCYYSSTNFIKNEIF